MSTPANVINVTTAGAVQFSGSQFSSGTLFVPYGGTGQTSYTTGDILYASASNVLSKLSATTNGYVLTLEAGIPAWEPPSGSASNWSTQNTNFNASVSNGYFVTSVAVATLPASPSTGDYVAFITTSSSTLTITANTGQRIRLGDIQSVIGGTCAASATGNTIELIYLSTSAIWYTLNCPVGQWTVT